MRDETMNTEIEVTTEVSDGTEVDQEITVKETSGPSKSFINAVVGCVTTLGIVVGLAIWKHRKNKRLNKEVLDEDYDEYLDDEEAVAVEAEEVLVTEEKSDDKEPAGKK